MAAAEGNYRVDKDRATKVPDGTQPFVTGSQQNLSVVIKDKGTMFRLDGYVDTNI